MKFKNYTQNKDTPLPTWDITDTCNQHNPPPKKKQNKSSNIKQTNSNYGRDYLVKFFYF